MQKPMRKLGWQPLESWLGHDSAISLERMPCEGHAATAASSARSALASCGGPSYPGSPIDGTPARLPQELLLILEDHWRRNKDVQGVPIYQASGLATKALSVYQAYIEMMNEDIRAAFDQVRPASLLSCSAAA